MDKVIIIGAGLSGATMARLFAESGADVIVVDKRANVGGNAYDYEDKSGIIVQAYGPHVFHTDDKKVFDFLSLFTEWKEYKHKVLAHLRKDKQVPLPFNLTSLSKVFLPKEAEKIKAALISEYGEGAKITINELRKNKNRYVKEFADYVYKYVFYIYMIKKWGEKPERLGEEITRKIPIVLSEEDGFFADKYQALPAHGFTDLVSNLLRHPKIKLKLKTSASSLIAYAEDKIYLNGKPFDGAVIYTGCLDELFNYKHGKLPYRSTKFKIETIKQSSYQDAAVVNYTVSNKFTRTTEFTKYTSSPKDVTLIMKEYPKVFKKNKNEPLYPVPTLKNRERHALYVEEVKKYKNLYVTGRLAEYTYMNMDEAVKRAMALYERITEDEINLENIKVLRRDKKTDEREA